MDHYLALDEHAAKIIGCAEKLIMTQPAKPKRVTSAEINLTHEGDLSGLSYAEWKEGKRADQTKFYRFRLQPGEIGPVEGFNDYAQQFATEQKINIKPVTDKNERFGSWPFFFLSAEVWRLTLLLQERLRKTLPAWSGVNFNVGTLYPPNRTYDQIKKRIKSQFRELTEQDPSKIKALAEFVYSTKEQRDWLFGFLTAEELSIDDKRKQVLESIEQLAISGAEHFDIEDEDLSEINDIVDDWWFDYGCFDCEYFFDDDPLEAKIAESLNMEKIYRKAFKDALRKKFKSGS